MSRFTPTQKGIGLMLLALTCFSGLDATAKLATQTLPLTQVTSFRYFIALLVTLLLINPLKTKNIFKSERPFLQITRSLILLLSTVLNFIALQYLQLDQTQAILFATPFFVAVLAGPILGEWIGKFRWAAICVGFGGVLIITQPWAKSFHWAMGLSFIGSILYALYSITTKILSKSDSTKTTALHSSLWATPLIVGATFYTWVMPSSALEWFLLLSVGVYAGVGHWFMISAYRLAQASTLAPYIYFQIVSMVALGYLLFNQIPALHTLIGSSIIISCGLYMLYRERVKGLQENEKTDKILP